MVAKPGIILDLDNTLYNWIDLFCPSFRGMVHMLSRELNIPEDELYREFKEVYIKYGTVEHKNSIQDLSIWQSLDMPSKQINDLIMKANHTFHKTFYKRLRAYPGVVDSLKIIKSHGFVIIGLSDTYQRWAIHRLRRIKVINFFSALYGLRQNWDAPPPKTNLRVEILEELTPDQLKPNKNVILQICEDNNLDQSQTYYVGDSIAKDVRGAQLAGIVDIWAEYGTHFEEKNLETIRRITPWSPLEKSLSDTAIATIIPTHTIRSFSQIIPILGCSMPLFSFEELR